MTENSNHELGEKLQRMAKALHAPDTGTSESVETIEQLDIDELRNVLACVSERLELADQTKEELARTRQWFIRRIAGMNRAYCLLSRRSLSRHDHTELSETSLSNLIRHYENISAKLRQSSSTSACFARIQGVDDDNYRDYKS